MLRKYRFEILAIVAILVFSALFLRMEGAEFAGTDTEGSARAAEISGIPGEEFRPLIAQWVPPGGEVESALFALQAAIGGICVGWVFGYWKGLKEKERETGGRKG
ncbi:MAG: energy-coupling factor ABC transporter substrate-binding protein [Methanomicrobiales archaeon]|nr:energy-coupling factor ABC transporter substrate-binding protein [Methanomicrobiales archaeon]